MHSFKMVELMAVAALALSPLTIGCGSDSTPSPGGGTPAADAGTDASQDASQDVAQDAPKDAVNDCKPSCDGKQCGADDGCGNKCTSGSCSGTAVCQNGYCCDCGAGQTCCEGACVTLGHDDSNCGKCGVACSGQKCISGACGSCTPSCSGKTCGPDGCGGVCGAGTCPTGQGCVAGSCVSCIPACSGMSCGADGCGGDCGKCSGGTTCQNGACAACTPVCTGKYCGDDDGCGGKCPDGPCPGGGTCSNGTCLGACVPDCSGKACGSDGCGGQCGTCGEFFKCSTSGKCECTSICSTTGFLCGDDSCGSICGSACSGATPVCLPAQGCKPSAQEIGCSDLTREGFVNVTQYPTIAACAGKWNGGQNLRSTSTGTPCGDPAGGICAAPADLCAAGWHVCMKNGWPGDLSDRVSDADCKSAIAGTGIFIAATDTQVSQANCTCSYSPLPAPCSSDGRTVACGTDAAYVDHGCCPCAQCKDLVWAGNTFGAYTACNSAKNENGIIGVLCCKDPPVSGH